MSTTASDSVPSRDKFSVEVVTAANLIPRYLDCVPFFIDFWKLMTHQSELNFIPKVAIIADEIPASLTEYKDNLLLISPGNLDGGLVSQVIRIYMAGISKADFAITSDVDMLPMSPRIYEFGINAIRRPNDFVVLRDVLPFGEFPICYNLASSSTWKHLFINGDSSVDFFLESIEIKFNSDGSYTGIHGGVGWNIDQRFLFETVISSENKINLLKFSDSVTGHRRLDRAHHKFPFNWFLLIYALLGKFSDYHVHHPIKNHTIFVKFLFKILKLRGAKNKN